MLSHKRGTEEQFRAAALEIIAEEQRKNNRQLARDLLSILENATPPASNGPVREIGSLPKDKDRDAILVDIQSPNVTFDDIVLKPESKAAIRRVIEEFRFSDVLATHGLRPKSKILFVGPPGCGKTLCARIISSQLGLPLMYTHFDAVVSSYLGETAANLRKVFDYASRGHWVVLFDEFDAIGKRRDDENEHGELKRVVNSFLQLLDGFSASSLVISATNHEQLLDPALWRRFDEIISFPRPTTAEIEELISLKLRNFPHAPINLQRLASRLKQMSHADIERICLDAIKACILEGKDRVDEALLDISVRSQKQRLHIWQEAFRKDGEKGD